MRIKMAADSLPERKERMKQVNNRHFWKWINKTDGGGGDNGGDTTEPRILSLNGTIAEASWFDDDITPQMFKDELNSGSGPITVYINSPGGDCVAASQIYTMLMEYPHDVTVKIDGIAASAASVIAMAGTKVLMAPTALMMCHNPATMAFGDHNEMQKAIDTLEAVKESIITAYEIKTGLDRKTLSDLMESETWMDATKAVELGFADGILEKVNRLINDANGMPATLFSQRAVDKALVNKAKAMAGIPIAPLYERLDRLRG